MRRALWGWGVALGIGLLAPASGRAQVATQNLGADPFSLYYGWYLPNQAYQAAQPRPEDTINANVASRQYNALRDRGELFEPSSPFAGDETDPFSPYTFRRGATTARPVGIHQGNVRGTGPQGYFYRHDRYFPGMRTGRGPNANLARLRTGRAGMSSMPSMPGLR